jgi:hypothetical protein
METDFGTTENTEDTEKFVKTFFRVLRVFRG